MYNPYDWLDKKLPLTQDKNSTLIDVGGYHGDFTQHFLATKKFTKAHVFEPNAEHYAKIESKFANEKEVFLYPYALGNETGSHNFNCSQDDATGSLLPYHQKYHHETAGKHVKTSTVEVAKLDDLYAKHFPDDKIGLIKIDTQGFDLEVLKGAENLIREHKPWLVIELNFMPFYVSQAPLHSVFTWLTDCGYHLGSLFNDHYSNDQWLAFADGVFVPEGAIDKVMEPFFPRLINEEMLEQNKYLKGVCEERLKLIEQLDSAATQRLEIINDLTEQLKEKGIKPKKPGFLRKLFG